MTTCGFHCGPIQLLAVKILKPFHFRNKILNQITFNIEVQQTLQLVHRKLAALEDASTMNFINETSHVMPGNLEADMYIYCLCPSNIMLTGMMNMAMEHCILLKSVAGPRNEIVLSAITKIMKVFIMEGFCCL